ncbi:hypothetical protein TI39_contig954g00015 [Zymoseptoria brevis]|uniref:NYN domain-containing protein n=1 Tax=Zymoseptoria brevis TaxID=1047168 RepID=A0A0F4GEM0_9PEZI|nr:hypothetical protein TI39_contig954g00015 [Zymoseptoria brevis]
MTTITEARPWDLSHVLDFVNTLSPKSANPLNVTDLTKEQNQPQPPGNDNARTVKENKLNFDTNGGVALGDFAKVWEFLGTPHPDTSTWSNARPNNAIPTKDDYASDGAAYKLSRVRHTSIQFSEGTDGEATGPGSGSDTAAQLASLTKTQRKKARRKERKAQQALLISKQNVVSESECDSTFSKRTPAKKGSTHVLPRSVSALHIAHEQERAMSPLNTPRAETISNKAAAEAVAKAAARLKLAGQPDTPCPKPATARAKAVSKTPSANIPKSPSKVAKQLAPSTPQKQDSKPAPLLSAKPNDIMTQLSAPRTGAQPRAAAQFSTPTNGLKYANLVPSSVQPVLNGRPTTPPQQSGTPTAPQHMVASATRYSNGNKPVIAPIVLRSGEDRHFALLMKIIGNFYEDRKHLVSPMNLTSHNNNPNGIHVFIDASNIFIGFVDQLKRARNIHPLQQVPDANLSFDGLALLMERRRPIAKRVLVGSTPRVAAFDKAEAVGYECSILEKVYKARELTERQIYFKEVEARRYGKAVSAKAPPPHKIALAGSVLTPGGSSASGSETNTPQFAPAKMIEQGVDEILHLKILESVVDTEVPTTIVLATGDAACAEYSSGFMAMVERALRKGWKVELVSWSKNISSMYTRPAWTSAWEERFRIITLDDYAEELLDM